MEQTQNRFEETEALDSLDIRDEIAKYLRYWPWLILSVVIALSAAFLYVRYTPNIYKSSTRIIIKDSKNPSEEEAILSNMGFQSGTASTNLENELAIFKSRRIMYSVVEALDLHVQYFAEGQFNNIEIYDHLSLVKLEYISGDEFTNLLRISFENNQVSILDTETEKVYKTNFGEPVTIANSTLLVSKQTEKDSGAILAKSFSKEFIASELRSRLNISTQEGSSIIQLTITDKISERGQDILNQLVDEYNKDAIEDNNLIAENTSKFINERLSVINNELDSVELNIENFKERNGLINIESEAQSFVSRSNQYEEQLNQLETQMILAEALKDEIDDMSTELLPANLGFDAGGINQLTGSYNQLVAERNKILAGSSEKNPLVKELNSQIETLKKNLNESLDRFLSNTKLAINEIEQKIDKIDSKISNVPSKEREFRNVSREQSIKESLFLFLLQRREENSISYGVETPKAKVVDRAFSLGIVSPSSLSVFVGAGFLGFLIPIMIIFGVNYFDNKIKSKRDIEKLVKNTPVLGEIPTVDKGESGLIQIHDRSVLAEAFRILTTSMQYVLAGIQNRSKDNTTIYVTSTVKGEGKTFTAFNLALTLCEGNNSVLIVGADLRNPQLQRYEEGAKVLKGVSDFIVSEDESIKNYINQSKLHPNLSIVTSGSIPPNPSELLKNYKIDSMFKELKGLYDYVIVDTAPAMLVADTFLINRFADLTLYVARAGYTEKNLLNFALEAKQSGKLSNVSFVLNDVKMSNFGYYGNKYGYTYAAEDNDKRKGLISRFKK
ncbi:GumC family protein [Zunongwangia profunda]|uniref:GumC family protein n=1 Tax=Zunongwangia profunda TaxID=398743 RepID=UPI001D18B20F|nr:polysaccharide biosynthesis tyrosine autokinase [Zunongwangia profunda]MCC4227304.1 polysaccharide biosynthesis tyrosine autokinase [Zunongwangia profunda]